MTLLGTGKLTKGLGRFSLTTAFMAVAAAGVVAAVAIAAPTILPIAGAVAAGAAVASVITGIAFARRKDSPFPYEGDRYYDGRLTRNLGRAGLGAAFVGLVAAPVALPIAAAAGAVGLGLFGLRGIRRFTAPD
jgi:hypothetical protein